MKRVISMVLCLMLVLSLATTAFAADITITGGADGSVYSAYKLLNATDGGDGKFAYTVNETYRTILQGIVDTDKTDDVVPTDDAIIAHINGLDATNLRSFANDVYAAIQDADPEITADAISTDNVFSGVAQGYYLIAETTLGSWGENEADDTYTLVMLDTAGAENISVATKEERPTLEKEITSDNNTITDDIADDKDHNNVSIGSLVQYTLTAEIPSNAVQYDFYYFIINDTLSEGLTLTVDKDHPVTVKAGDDTLTDGTDYKLYTGEDADGTYDLQVAMLKAKEYAGKTITVTYWAKLNENAVVGEKDGNSNTADLDYSNNPNFDYDGTQDTDSPGKPDSTKNVPIGDTPDEVTRTYTTGLKLIKTDEKGKILTGAEFQITGTNVVITLVSKDVFEETENGEYYGLKDGTYTKEAPQTEDKYEVAPAGATAGYVLVDGEYVEYNATEHAGQTIYILVEANSDLYDGKRYNKTVTYEQMTDSANTDVKAFVGVDGTLEFVGLGQGEYTITETTVPDGYNKIDDIEVVITWTPENVTTEGDVNDCAWTVKATVDGKETELNMNEDGLFELTVMNQSGSELPSTGGMGTTLFYVLGSIMVLAAVVLLVTKKRMSCAD